MVWAWLYRVLLAGMAALGWFIKKGISSRVG